jgi:hypothetical protein
MTLPDPTDVIAPRGDDLPYETSDFLQEMMEGAYPDGVMLDYHLIQRGSPAVHGCLLPTSEPALR